MRRVGKSTLLKIISDEILADVLPENKIHLNFESLELINIRDANSLLDYLMPIIKILLERFIFSLMRCNWLMDGNG